MGSLGWWAQLGVGCYTQALLPGATPQLWASSSKTQGDSWSNGLNVLVPPTLCTDAHPLLTSRTTNGGKALENTVEWGGPSQWPGGPTWTPFAHSHHYPSQPWLCMGPTFAISLSPLAPARQRAQAAAFLTLRASLADCTGQGTAWLLSHIWGWQKAGHRGLA